jgi:hypothetical protein
MDIPFVLGRVRLGLDRVVLLQGVESAAKLAVHEALAKRGLARA